MFLLAEIETRYIEILQKRRRSETPPAQINRPTNIINPPKKRKQFLPSRMELFLK